MKVILLQDVPNVGRKYEVKEVASGYAANALLPKGLAVQASPQKIKQLEKKKEAHEKEVAAKEGELKAQLQTLEGQTIELSAKASEKGGLFKGFKEEDVVKLVKEQKEIELSEGDLKFDSPIKTIGEHAIVVSHGDTKQHSLSQLKSNNKKNRHLAVFYFLLNFFGFGHTTRLHFLQFSPLASITSG